MILSVHLIAPGVWQSGEYLRGECPTEGGPGRNAQAQPPRVYRPGWWACATRPETGRRVQLGSAQLRSVMAAGMRRRTVMLRKEARGKRASSRSGPNSVSTEGRERGTVRPPGSREMSADETKKAARQQQSMSRCRLVRPKHRVDSVLPVFGGQAEHGPGRAALQMGCRIIRLPNARTSGPICVSSRRDVVAGRLQDRTCRTGSRLTGRVRVGGAACTRPKQMPVPSLTAAWR